MTKEANSEEITLLCGKKITVTKEESDYLKDELTPTLETCLKNAQTKKYVKT